MEKLNDPVTQQRKHTRNNIFRCIYNSSEPISKQEIAAALSLSLPTVHQNLTELTDAGLVVSGGMQQSTGGRPAKGMIVKADARFAIGLSITENHLRFYAADLNLNELAYKRKRIALETGEDLGPLAAQHLEQFLDEYQLDRNKLLGVGIAVPAAINWEHRCVLYSPTLHKARTGITGLLECLPYKTYLENDGNCGGYAESWARGNESNDCIAYLHLEYGVGGAVIIGGVPYVGQNRRSSEFGHMCVEANGRLCNCGRRGCLEAYCSARRLIGTDPDGIEGFFDGLKADNPAHVALFEDYIEHLARGIHNIRMAFDCEIVLGGFYSPWLEPYLEGLNKRVRELDTFDSKEDYVFLANNPANGIVQGAALYFIQEFLDSI